MSFEIEEKTRLGKDEGIPFHVLLTPSDRNRKNIDDHRRPSRSFVVRSFSSIENIKSIMPEEPIPMYTIKDVWAHNVEEEFRSIRKLIVKYPFVAMVRWKSSF